MHWGDGRRIAVLGLAALRRILTRVSARLFSHRQIILRSPRRVRWLELAPRRQLAILLLVPIGGAWLAHAHVRLFTFDAVLGEETRRADELQRAYDILDSELVTALDQLSHLRDLLNRQESTMRDLSTGASDLQRSLLLAGRQLDNLASERDAALRDSRLLLDRVVRLEGRFPGRTGNPRSVLERLEDRALQSVHDLEQIISMANLDPARLTRIYEAEEKRATGGPFHSAKAAIVGETNVPALLARWAMLQGLVQRMPLGEPAQGNVVSGFGLRSDPISNRPAMHEGIDIAGAADSTIRAAAPGTVMHAERSGAYGLLVEIDHGMGFRTRYGHLKEVFVHRGDRVGASAVIGTMGSTGRSTGTHLHYELSLNGDLLDPQKFLETGRHVRKDRTNGPETGRQ